MANKKPKTGPSFSDSDGSSSDICDANCNSDVGYSLANFFLMAGINHNMVESSSFTSLIKALSPESALPSSVELESKLIPSFKTKVEQYVSGAKKSWIETGCTLITIFELNEKGGSSFLSIFGCSRERIVLLYTFEVPTNTDSVALAPFLQQSVHLVVEAVSSDNIVQCVVDASQYGKYFCEFLGSKFPHVYLTKCAAREVQFMFEEIYQNVEWVSKTFSIIKLIVDYICYDTAILALMRKYTNGKELIQSPGVNLLSSYKMLESILEVKEHLVQLVQSPEWLADYCKGQRGIEVTTYIKDPQTWKWGEEVEKGLRSLSQVLCSVDFHDSGSGYLYGLMEIVEYSFSQHWNNNQDMYQRLWDIYMLKKEQILTEFHSVAAFLNPAYMLTEQAKDVDWNPVISTILGRFIAKGDRVVFVNEVQEYMKILSDETKLFETTAAKAYHPCQWWGKCVKKLTMLRDLAIKILSQPCSSTSSCKSSMRTVEAVLVKEQRELERGITYLDLKMNAILMERFKKDKACKREKIVLEEFSKQRSNNGESTSRPMRQLKLHFLTVIASPIRTSQNVEGENGCRIHVCLVDPATGRVVQDEIPSTLQLTITVLDGHFSNEASSDGRTGREYFNINELSGSYMTGDLKVNLIRGEGTLGTFSFNCSSGSTKSGKFKLAVKTQTGDSAGFRILAGISNAFIVEDTEEVSTELPMAYVDPHNGSFFGNTGQELFSNHAWQSLIQTQSDSHLAVFGDTYINYQFSGFNKSLAQTAARRLKKKALGRKRRGKGVLKPRRAMYSSGSNNVNQQEDGGEVNNELVEIEGIDSLSSTSARTLFGVRVGSSSGAKPVGEIPTHPSNALQLSLIPDRVLEPREVELESAKNVKQQPKSPAITIFGVPVSCSGVGETHEGHSSTVPVMLTTEDNKEISYIGVRKGSSGRYDVEIQEQGGKVGTFDTVAKAAMAYDDAAARQFLGPYAKTNFPIDSEPKINSTGRVNLQISNGDDTPQEVEEIQLSTAFEVEPLERVQKPTGHEEARKDRQEDNKVYTNQQHAAPLGCGYKPHTIWCERNGCQRPA